MGRPRATRIAREHSLNRGGLPPDEQLLVHDRDDVVGVLEERAQALLAATLDRAQLVRQRGLAPQALEADGDQPERDQPEPERREEEHPRVARGAARDLPLLHAGALRVRVETLQDRPEAGARVGLRGLDVGPGDRERPDPVS